MPIYAYRCDSCGARQDVLQKLSDTPLAVCPVCGAPTFQKELSAPAFQLKGSGWYVTDFRDRDKPNGPATDKPAGDGPAVGKPSGAPDGGSGDAASAGSRAPDPVSTSSAAPPSRTSSSGTASTGSSGSASAAPTKTPVA